MEAVADSGPICDFRYKRAVLMFRGSIIFGASVSCLLLAGCGSKPPLGLSPHVALLQDGQMPVPTAQDLTFDGHISALGPLDEIQVDVFGIEDFERKLQIDASGNFEFPLIGTVEASGRTPGEVSAEIERRLRSRYVKDPQVTINLLEAVSRRVTVDGEVVRPGVYPMMGGMTLMMAVASAEGLTAYADSQDVVVFRTVGGERYVALYNLEGIRRGNYDDPRVYPNDKIIVGDSPSIRMFENLTRIAPLITTPLIILSRQ